MVGFNGFGASGSGPCKMVASFKFGATLKGFREVESAVTVVGSPVLVGKLTSSSDWCSFIQVYFSWRWSVCIQLFFESQVSVLQLKKLFSLLIFSEITARESAIHSAL